MYYWPFLFLPVATPRNIPRHRVENSGSNLGILTTWDNLTCLYFLSIYLYLYFTEGHHQEWSLWLNLTQHGETHQARTLEGLTDWSLFLDSVGGGAWPFLVGGAICLVNSDNERDSSLLNRPQILCWWLRYFLEGLVAYSHTRLSNNRSVMPLDVQGRTRATLKGSAWI